MSFFDASMEPMLDMFIFEANTLIEQLDEIMLNAEKSNSFSDDDINEIFRIMHTIKGSSAMMGITSMSELAHKVEDMFFIIRENKSIVIKDISKIFDIIFSASDFFKNEMQILNNDDYSPSDVQDFVNEILGIIDELKSNKTESKKSYDTNKEIKKDKSVSKNKKTKNNNILEENIETSSLKQNIEEILSVSYKIFFDEGVGMENIRAFMLLNAVKEVTSLVSSEPENPEQDFNCSSIIESKGFILHLHKIELKEKVENVLSTFANVKDFKLIEKKVKSKDIEDKLLEEVEKVRVENKMNTEKSNFSISNKEETKSVKPLVNNTVKKQQSSSLISVNQMKLDELMDIVGEIVIAESMVTANPDLDGLELDNFYKASRQLKKLTNELQDIVMSIRMVPISGIFSKMNRVVRDVSKKLGKNVVLETIGGDTEVDKTISDIISDPFMHMIRNAVDHAIEMPEDRLSAGKSEVGTVVLEAQNVGGEIIIKISDDGKGLNAEEIYHKAVNKGMNLKSRNEYTEKEIFSLIMQPGFSTKEVVTEFSGRGVGMDVVKQNIEKVGGFITVDSELGKGTTFTIKIPLTLAIVDGMTFSVGKSSFTIPITSIRESFTLSEDKKLIKDTDGNELIMLRGECYPILNLHNFYNIQDEVISYEDGIFILIEVENEYMCLFADCLLSEQQVVIKPFPRYLNKYNIKNKGLSGCTILGDGSISLILDANALVSLN